MRFAPRISPVAQKLFGTDGIRGPANVEPITSASAMRLMDAATVVLAAKDQRPRAIVGRDTRASGEMLESAIAAGLAANGIDVILAGIVPTPAISYLTAIQDAAFGIVISASHNPFDDNGIKFFGPDGYKLSDSTEAAIEAEFFNPTLRSPRIGRAIGRITRLLDGAEQYAAFASNTFPKDLSLAGIRIVVDAANGAAHQTTPLVLSKLGAEIDLCFASPDGWNINEGCGSTHPGALSARVRKTGATLGLAHDGDADRLLFCDETGDPLDGDELLAIAAVDLLSRDELKSRTMVATVMSNFGLDHLLENHKAKLLRTDVGDRHVIDAMVRHHLNLGGEQSGHLIFRDFSTTGDGLIAALQILAVVAETQKPLSVLRTVLKKVPQVQRNVRVRQKVPISQLPSIVKVVSRGETLLAGKGRILLRYSGTELMIRLLLEGPEPAILGQIADSIVTEIQGTIGA
jgi:phosphoglucosamine mutase